MVVSLVQVTLRVAVLFVAGGGEGGGMRVVVFFMRVTFTLCQYKTT